MPASSPRDLGACDFPLRLRKTSVLSVTSRDVFKRRLPSKYAYLHMTVATCLNFHCRCYSTLGKSSKTSLVLKLKGSLQGWLDCWTNRLTKSAGLVEICWECKSGSPAHSWPSDIVHVVLLLNPHTPVGTWASCILKVEHTSETSFRFVTTYCCRPKLKLRAPNQ